MRRLRYENATSKGGRPLNKGEVYKLLNNRTCVGEVAHKGKVYPGEHRAVVPRDLWARARGPAGQPALAGEPNLAPHIGSRGKMSEVLAGKRPLSPAMIRTLHKNLGLPAPVTGVENVLVGTDWSTNRVSDGRARASTYGCHPQPSRPAPPEIGN